jgi:hypothetical protein
VNRRLVGGEKTQIFVNREVHADGSILAKIGNLLLKILLYSAIMNLSRRLFFQSCQDFEKGCFTTAGRTGKIIYSSGSKAIRKRVGKIRFFP